MPILMQNHSGGDSVAWGMVLPAPTSSDLCPRQYLPGDDSASSKSNEQLVDKVYREPVWVGL